MKQIQNLLTRMWLPAAFTVAILMTGCESTKVKNSPEAYNERYPQREVKGYSTSAKPKEAPAPAPTPGADTIYEDHLVRLEKVYKSGSTVGSDFNYDIIVTAKRAVTNVEVDEFLPESIKFKSSTPKASMNQFGMPSWDLEAFEAGAQETINVTVTPTKVGDYKVCSVVRADPLICLPLYVGQPELQITKTGPARVELGEQVKWDIGVKNTGTATAESVVITDTVPAGFTAVGPTTKTVGDMEPGDTATFQVTGKSTKVGKYTNVASANFTGGDPVTASAPIEVVQSSVKIAKTGPASAYIFVNQPYKITVTNTGNTTLNNLVVTDKLPEGAVLIGKVADGGEVADIDTGKTVFLTPQYYAQKGVHGYWKPGSENPMADDYADQITWKIDSLAAGASKSFDVSFHANAPMTTVNTATVATDRGLTDTATAETVWKAVPGVHTTLMDDPDPIQIGETTVYTLKTLNQSRFDTFTVTSQEVTIPDGMTIVAADGGTISGNKVTYLPATLGPRKEMTRTITVKGTKSGTLTTVMETMTNFRDTPIVDQESTTVY